MGPRTCSGTRLCAASGGGSSVVRDHAGTKGSQAWPLFARMTHTNQEVHPSSIRSRMLRRKFVQYTVAFAVVYLRMILAACA